MAAEKTLLRAEEADAGKRLDGWIAEKCPDLTRSFAQKLIESGKVEVDGRPAGKKDKNLRVTSGMEVSLTLPEPEPKRCFHVTGVSVTNRVMEMVSGFRTIVSLTLNPSSVGYSGTSAE